MNDIHVTVAAVVEHNNRFLIVEEKASCGRTVYNQPAGHVEPKESILTAVEREMMEETGLSFSPNYLIGNYFLSPADNGKHYLRFCFAGQVNTEQPPQPQDSDIIAAHWWTLEQILEKQTSLRSGLVLKSIEDYLLGKRYPLEQFHHCNNESQMAEMCYTRLPQI